MSLLGDCVLWEEDLLRDHRTGYVHLQMIHNHFCSPETQNEKTVWERQSGCVSCFTFPLYAGKWSSSPWALFVQQLKRKHFMSLQRVNIWSYGLTKFQQSSWRKNRSHWFPLNKAVSASKILYPLRFPSTACFNGAWSLKKMSSDKWRVSGQARSVLGELPMY